VLVAVTVAWAVELVNHSRVPVVFLDPEALAVIMDGASPLVLEGYVSLAVIVVELMYGVVLLKPAVVVGNVVSVPWGLIVLSDSDHDIEDAADCQTKVVLIGKGKLVGCSDMMTVLIPGKLSREVD
jgi:hypothetical protein